VFERPDEGPLRPLLRNSDVLVAVGAPAAPADHVLSNARAVRDILESAFGPVEEPVGGQPPLDDCVFLPPPLSALPARTNTVAASPH
jgi:hypothetical protein